MKLFSAKLISLALVNVLTIPYAISSQQLSVEERLNQLEHRLQQSEFRAAAAEQENVQLRQQLRQNIQDMEKTQKIAKDLDQRTQKIEKNTPDDNGYFELHGYARSGLMTSQNARHAQGGHT